MTFADKLAPANIEAEEAVLGSLLIDPSAVVRIAATLVPEDFARPAHARIFDAILEIYRRGTAVDIVTVVAQLERRELLADVGGAAYLTELMERTPVAIHVDHYAVLVERDAIRRRLLAAAGEIAQLAHTDEAETIEQTVDQAEEALFRVLRDRKHRDLVPLGQLVEEYFEKIEEIRANRELMLGVRTGFEDLDHLLGGLQPSDLCIVAGRPSMGKTSWLTTVATSVAAKGGTVALFSLEMSGEQLVQRLIAGRTGISTHQLRLGDIRTDDELVLVTRAIGELAALPIYIDDTAAITPFELRTKVRRLHSERGVDLVIIDYLQLMRGVRRTENRVQEISIISGDLKALAREVRVPVIAASQLSRAVEGRKDRRPQLSDLRESGSIEQDADMVIFLYRDVVYNQATEKPNIAEVHVAKHRHGPTGNVEMVFVPHETRFADLEKEPLPVGVAGP